MAKTDYERDMEDTLQKIADALGVSMKPTPDVELLIAKAQKAGKDAKRYRWVRNNPQWLGWEHDFRPDEVEREIDAAMASETAVRAA